MFESILTQISDFTPFWIYLTIFFFAFIENLFPPSPSDIVVVIGGSLVGTGTISIYSITYSRQHWEVLPDF